MRRKRVSLMNAVNRVVPDKYFISRVNRDSCGVYLTFDDSPHPVWTRRSLDLLDEIGVKATYFMVGQEAMRHSDLAREVSDRGHAVGNHTYSHRSIVGLSKKDLELEVVESRRRLSDLCGCEVKMFRPPWGKLDLRTARYIIADGQRIVMWSIDSTDYDRKSTADIMARLDEVGVGGGDIVLFHDDNEQTLAVLQPLVEKVRRSGLDFKNLEGN